MKSKTEMIEILFALNNGTRAEPCSGWVIKPIRIEIESGYNYAAFCNEVDQLYIDKEWSYKKPLTDFSLQFVVIEDLIQRGWKRPNVMHDALVYLRGRFDCNYMLVTLTCKANSHVGKYHVTGISQQAYEAYLQLFDSLWCNGFTHELFA